MHAQNKAIVKKKVNVPLLSLTTWMDTLFLVILTTEMARNSQKDHRLKLWIVYMNKDYLEKEK